MEFREYQLKASYTALYLDGVKKRYPGAPIDLIGVIGLMYAGLGLGEAGEVQGKIKKIVRDNNGIVTIEKKEEIKKELGDLLWYIAAVCNELNISMDDVAIDNLTKLLSRAERGTIKGDGDNR